MKFKHKIARLICFIALAVGLSFQHASAFQAKRNQAENPLTLAGVAVDSNGKLISNPIVKFLPRGERSEIVKKIEISSEQDGSFMIKGVPRGCEPNFQITDSTNQQVQYLSLNASNKVKGQDNLEKLRVVLEEGSTVKGKVICGGKPSKGTVYLDIKRGRSVDENRMISYEAEIRLWTKTNEQGQYTFDNVSPENQISIGTQCEGKYQFEGSRTALSLIHI